MSAVIVRCIDSLLASGYPKDRFEINVIADHCTDDTAEVSRRSGANVLERNDGPAGKTYTLAWALEKLAEGATDPDLFVVVDATAHVENGFLEALVHLWRQGENIVVSHPVVDSENQKWFARCLGLTLVHRNLQNRARQRLKLSAFIEGRGMAYSRQYIQEFGWRLALPTSSRSGTHPTEDWRHAVRAVEQGNRVAFADDARVITPLRGTLSAATKQGVRWERGRMANAFSHASRLLLHGIKKRNVVKSLAALDAIQPPVAILGAVCAVIAFLAIPFPGSRTAVTLSFIPLLVFVFYGLVVVLEGRKDGISPITVLWAPVYLLWRTSAFILAWGFLDKLRVPAATDKK
jgi:cellulose synthase/poly-beta-1,6-N-acetylglucosamine synthase-like glycosyltransferase